MLRWFFTFQTFNGNTCRVEISDTNYQGTAVELNKDVVNSPGCPSDNPVVIEEDKTNDLLQAVRLKTGYLHLIELTDGGLSAMFPETGRQMSVEITVESQLIFRGYIQSQSFESKYRNYRNIVDVPIVSAIGAILNERMSDSAWGTPSGMCKLGRILEDEFNYYTYLVMPDFDIIDDESEPIHPLNVEVPINILSPSNNDFNFGVPDIGGNPVSQYNIMTHGDFLDAFCSFYGVIFHEVGDAIVFIRPDYNGKYIRMEMSELYNPYTTQVEIGDSTDETSILSLFDFADNKSKSYGILPLSQLRISPEPIESEDKADFTQANYVTYDHTRSVAVLHNLNSNIGLSNYTELPNPASAVFTRLVGDGGNEMIQVHFSGNTSEQLARFGFYTPKYCNFNHFVMKLKNYTAGLQLKIAIRSGGKYLNFTDEGDLWIDTPTYSTATVDNTGEISWWAVTNGQFMEVFVYSVQSFDAYITEAKVCIIHGETGSDVISKYTNQIPRDLLVDGDTQSDEKASITSPFLYRSSEYYDIPLYRYTILQQRAVKLNLRPKASFAMLALYMEMLSVAGDANIYRMLSVSHEVVTDTYTLQIATFTLQ